MRDSAIVATFIFTHNAARMFGESFRLARGGLSDPWQPVVSNVANLWSGGYQNALLFGEHLMFWVSLGAVLAFLPYFPFSKHVHLFFAPINFALKPQRRSIGELSYINLDDQSIEQFGAAKMSDLGWEQIMDSYACIMCFRCQEIPHEVGYRLERAHDRAESHAGDPVVGRLRGGNGCPRTKNRTSVCKDPERGRRELRRVGAE
jgi:hypothetical protein